MKIFQYLQVFEESFGISKTFLSAEIITILIEDEGIGVAESELEKIFQPFYRVEENANFGFGLGLSLANQIIKLHKGRIAVNSVINHGSMFSIALPSAGSLMRKE